ncbi:MAG: hypothetical protein V4813_00860 [Gemmatimonadota bacterium]
MPSALSPLRAPLSRLVLPGVALFAVGLACLAAREPVTTVSAPLVRFDTTHLSESDVRDRDIAFYDRRVSADPQGAADRVTLASLLLSRSRHSGSTADLARAESLATASVALRTVRNAHALEVLASVQMARHAFRDAHRAAAAADSIEPGNASHLALLGEIELELGEYAAADSHFRAVRTTRDQFTVGARLARWYELTGRSARARTILQDAITAVDLRDDLPREQVAWFHYRLGELELRVGRLAAADSAFQRGLVRNPDDIRLLGGLARTALARHDWKAAAAYGDRATLIQLDPATLGVVSEAYAALGDSTQATSFAGAMAASALSEGNAMHRAWGMHLLDHGTPAQRAEVLRRARADIRERSDVYGHDMLAWALYRDGQLDAARREMALAVAQGTEDVMLDRHAQVLLRGTPMR